MRTRRPGRAIRALEFLPNFNKEFQEYLYKTIQKEAESIKIDKETSVANFCRDNLGSFSYEKYHEKLLDTTPLLSAALTGALSNLPFNDFEVSDCHIAQYRSKF